MLFNHPSLTADEFLSRYWQKEPLLFRQAFPGFEPELDANDVAGLACEELAESRLITGSFPANDWTLRHGPFSEKELTALPGNDWTLLVQDVEKHYPPLKELFRAFSFLPGWRLDDLMISVASPGGSVGPHVDQYDVFLLQAGGTRKWRIAKTFDPALQPNSELKVLKSFEPEQEWVLETGDLLYLPPNVAHHGIALDTGMTWSFGLRAPSSADLLQALGEWLADREDEGERYRDGPLSGIPVPGEIGQTALDDVTDMLVRAVRNPSGFRQFIGSFLSTYRLVHEPAVPEKQIGIQELEDSLSAGMELQPNPWTRLIWLKVDDEAILFAAGEAFRCSESIAVAVCGLPRRTGNIDPPGEEFLRLCSTLLNRGHLYLE